MSSNRFTSQRRTTKLVFTPLTVTCQLNVANPNSPAAQEYDAYDDSYNPDHSVYPVKIHPAVMALDKDGLGFPQHVNHLLSIGSGDLVWYLNGKAIGTVWNARATKTGEGDFWIDTQAHDERGTLWIFKNFNPDETLDLCFKGTFADWRTQQVIVIESDHIQLSCSSKAPDEIKITVNKEMFEYDPFYDTKLLYDYLTARGISYTPSVAGKQYPLDVRMTVQTGRTSIRTAADLLAEGMSVQIVRRGGDTPLTPGSDSAPELVTFSFPIITLDCRQIDNNEYTIQLIKDNEVVATADFMVVRHTTMPSVELTKPMRGVDIPYGEEFYDNQAFVVAQDGAQITYPEAFFLIKWFTQLWKTSGQTPAYDTAKAWQIGEVLQATTKGIGLLENVLDTRFDVYFELEEHAVMGRCKDTCIESSSDPNYETEYYFTDENNNHLII